MFKNILVAITISLVLISTASAKEITKSGGYTLCKNELKEAFPERSIDTKILRIKYRSHKKSKVGVTHKILMRVAGIRDSAYKVSCVVTRDHDNYAVVLNDAK